MGQSLLSLIVQCSGNVPCENCVKAQTTCQINEDGDRRRKHVLKRKLEIFEDKGNLLDRLIEVLQRVDDISALQLINLIRSHATLDEVRAFIDDILERSKLEKTPELVDVCDSVRNFHATYNREAHEDPTDRALFQVPAYPWTTVTSDDAFVSHLISLWFTWSHPFLNWVDRDLFIQSMQSQDKESQFCSPCLVNTILADACVGCLTMRGMT